MPIRRTLAALVFLALGLAAVRADEVRTLSNKTVAGTLVGVNDKELSVRTEGGAVVNTPLHEVLAVDLREVKGVPQGTKYSDVRLLDDTLLHCSKVAFKANQVEITLLSGQQVKLPLNSLVSVLHDAQDPTIRKEWDIVLAHQVKRDRIVILKNDELNPIEGTFGDVDPKAETIQFRLEGGIIRPIPLARLQGLVFYRTESPAKSPVCQVFDVQGNSLAAAAVVLKGKTFAITTVGGIEINYDAETIARFDYNMGKLTFLSDVTPAKVDDAKAKALGHFPTYRTNLNLSDTQIQLGDKVFSKGLSLWAPLELEYNLGGRYKEFKAFVGIDGQVGGGGKVRLTIERDGENVWSKDLAPGAVMPVAFPVQRANRLRFIVTSDEGLGFSAHVEIAEARVTQ